MSKTILITRPNHEITTNYLFYWSQEIIDFGTRKGHKVVALDGKRANKREFTGVVGKVRPTLIMLNGHGSATMVTGQDNESLLTLGDNEELIVGVITFARACSSAKDLGPSSVAAGAKAYLGYSNDFVFPIDETFTSRPLQDHDAGLFLLASNQVVIALMKGHTASESNQRSRELYKKTMQSLLTSESTSDQASLVPYLFWDYKHQVCLGDPEARI